MRPRNHAQLLLSLSLVAPATVWAFAAKPQIPALLKTVKGSGAEWKKLAANPQGAVRSCRQDELDPQKARGGILHESNRFLGDYRDHRLPPERGDALLHIQKLGSAIYSAQSAPFAPGEGDAFVVLQQQIRERSANIQDAVTRLERLRPHLERRFSKVVKREAPFGHAQRKILLACDQAYEQELGELKRHAQAIQNSVQSITNLGKGHLQLLKNWDGMIQKKIDGNASYLVAPKPGANGTNECPQDYVYEWGLGFCRHAPRPTGFDSQPLDANGGCPEGYTKTQSRHSAPFCLKPIFR